MKQHRLIRFCCVALLLICGTARGQILRDHWSHEVTFGGGYCLNEHFSIEFSYFYFPWRYLGVGGYVGMHASGRDRQIPFGPVSSTPDYSSWILTSEHAKVTGLTLTPSLLLTTPAVRVNALAISLRVIPGVTLGLPRERIEVEYREVDADKLVEYSNYKYERYWLKGNQWLSWSGKVALNLSIDELGFGLGYGVSNYDIWNTRRSGNIEGTSFQSFYPTPQALYHYFFLYASWKF